MTVLQKKDAAGFETGQIVRTLLAILLFATIGVGIVFAINPSQSNTATLAPSADELAQMNELNKADIGVPTAADVFGSSPTVSGAFVRPSDGGPFLNGTGAQTHKGRTAPVQPDIPVYQDPVNRADDLFRQQAAERVDPADLKFK